MCGQKTVILSSLQEVRINLGSVCFWAEVLMAEFGVYESLGILTLSDLPKESSEVIRDYIFALAPREGVRLEFDQG